MPELSVENGKAKKQGIIFFIGDEYRFGRMTFATRV
jgi:hypothetical protein